MPREARRLGQIGADDYDRATDLGTIRAERLPRGRLVSEAEVAALLRTGAGDPSPAGTRNAAIIALLRGIGLCRAEAVALNLADYDPESGGMSVQRGKGRTDRIVYAPAGARRPRRLAYRSGS